MSVLSFIIKLFQGLVIAAFVAQCSYLQYFKAQYNMNINAVNGTTGAYDLNNSTIHHIINSTLYTEEPVDATHGVNSETYEHDSTTYEQKASDISNVSSEKDEINENISGESAQDKIQKSQVKYYPIPDYGQAPSATEYSDEYQYDIDDEDIPGSYSGEYADETGKDVEDEDSENENKPFRMEEFPNYKPNPDWTVKQDSTSTKTIKTTYTTTPKSVSTETTTARENIPDLDEDNYDDNTDEDDYDDYTYEDEDIEGSGNGANSEKKATIGSDDETKNVESLESNIDEDFIIDDLESVLKHGKHMEQTYTEEQNTKNGSMKMDKKEYNNDESEIKINIQ